LAYENMKKRKLLEVIDLEDLKENTEIINNIRLWDSRSLLSTYENPVNRVTSEGIPGK